MKEETKDLIDKAGRAIHAAESLAKDGDYDFSAGRAYYAMFYVAQALLYEKGFRDFKKHSRVHAAFGTHYSKTGVLESKYHGWLISAFDKRVKSDYDTKPYITESTADSLIQQAREFLEAARKYLSI